MAAQILLVDDNDLLAEAMMQYLTAVGYEVHREQDAHHALAHLATSSAALGVLDVRLPGMDGIALCTEVRKRSAMPILLMTGADSDELRQRASAAGAAATLQKPIAFKELAQAITHLLQEQGVCSR